MKYYKWNIFDDAVVVIRENENGWYEPYFGKKIGFALDFYDDYLQYFFEDKSNDPQKITEITEEEAFNIIKEEND